MRATVYELLKAEGILIRYFDDPLLADRLRITVGTDAQNQRLLAAFRRLVHAAAEHRPGPVEDR